MDINQIEPTDEELARRKMQRTSIPVPNANQTETSNWPPTAFIVVAILFVAVVGYLMFRG
jgi:hypothetical protein